MSHRETEEHRPHAKDVPDQADEGSGASPDGEPQASSPDDLTDTQEGLETIRAERDDLEGKLLRVSADYQNYVRRAQQNTTDACEQQLMRLAKSLLTPLDHFDHALGIDPEKTSAQDVLQGVQIARDELLKVLEQMGIKRMEVNPGDDFDPNRHEALQRVAAEGIESGSVASQLQPGYLLGEKTARPAKVMIAE